MRNQKNNQRILTVFAILALFSGVFFNSQVVQGADFSWTQRALPSSDSWQSVAYGNGTFVTLDWGLYSTTTKAATSPDGITWTARTLPASAHWRTITYGDGIFVAVAGGSNIAATSPDGINWTQRTLPVSSQWSTVTYGNGKFVALSWNSSDCVTSPNGINWTQITMPASGWYSVVYGIDRFVAVTYNSNVAATSPDGITWTQRTMPASSGYRSVAYGNGKFVATPRNTNKTAVSSDGIFWEEGTLPASGDWFSVAYGNEMFVAINSSGGTNMSAVSLDGLTWVEKTLPSASWYSTAYGNGTFVVVSSSNVAANSNGGIYPFVHANMDIDATIALSCTDEVIMGTIIGTGESNLSTNDATCIVSTANSTGYSLSWEASEASLENQYGDVISAYTPQTLDTPENWSVSATESEWGAKLKSESTTYNSFTWGDEDTYSGGKWLDLSTDPRVIITRSTETSQEGDTEVILFGAEIGSNKFQPTGTYDTEVIITATTL